jgi:hypothetical protein
MGSGGGSGAFLSFFFFPLGVTGGGIGGSVSVDFSFVTAGSSGDPGAGVTTGIAAGAFLFTGFPWGGGVAALGAGVAA